MNAYPGRLYGQYHAEPTHDIMKRVRELDHYVRGCGPVCLAGRSCAQRCRPGLPVVCEGGRTDVTFQTQVGDTGPL
jgi:hypothetical protein